MNVTNPPIISDVLAQEFAKKEFAKWLVIDALIQDGFEVRQCDSRAAQLVAEKHAEKHAVRIKPQRLGPNTNKGVLVSEKDIEELEWFSKDSGTIAYFAFVVIVPDEEVIHLALMPCAAVPTVLRTVELGFRKDIAELVNDPSVRCWCWRKQVGSA